MSINPLHQIAVTAQYGSGHLDIYQLNHQLTMERHLQTIDSQNQAHQQQFSHAHQAILLNHTKTLVSVDLGLDRLIFYPFDQQSNQFSQTDSQVLLLPPNSGPRHLVFHHREDTALLLCECSEQLFVLVKQAEQWHIQQQLNAFPGTMNGQAGGAIKLSADEKFVYLTGRRQNIISCFAVDWEKLTLTYVESVACGGEFPRDIALSNDGEWLVVANQNSANIVSFKRDRHTGQLTATGKEIHVSHPVCLVFEN